MQKANQRQPEPLVVTVSSRALFNLEKENQIFQSRGLEAYRKYQRDHEDDTLSPGVAFPLIRKLLKHSRKEAPVDVVVLSRNDGDTSLRIFRSIAQHDLKINRAAFTNGTPSDGYLAAFGSSLFLSGDLKDVKQITQRGHAAAHVMGAPADPTLLEDTRLRLAFDFDGVIADDASERVFRKRTLEEYLAHERKRAGLPLGPGPLYHFLQRLFALKRATDSLPGLPRIRTALFTARGAEGAERIVHTLRKDAIVIDEMVMLEGARKGPFVKVFRPDIYFDDQLPNLEGLSGVPTAFIPYGVANG